MNVPLPLFVIIACLPLFAIAHMCAIPYNGDSFKKKQRVRYVLRKILLQAHFSRNILKQA